MQNMIEICDRESQFKVKVRGVWWNQDSRDLSLSGIMRY